MRFTKMEGLGNDYVYVDGFTTRVPDPESLAKRISDRNFGVGADGLILILPSDRADIRMEMRNSDGSRAEMCGNGLRCVGFYAFTHGLVESSEMSVETDAGILPLTIAENGGDGTGLVRIEMGKPRLLRSEIPMVGPEGRVVLEPIEVEGETYRLTAVSMGNPHAVIFVDDVAAFPVVRVGRAIEIHPLFPKKVNVEFVEVRGEHEVSQRTFERGAGETLACGTGAAAVMVASHLAGRASSPLTIHLRGGDLLLEWDGEGQVRQTGPVVEVFHGEWPDHRL